MSSAVTPVRLDRGGDRGHPQREDGGRRRRSRARERGRPRRRRPVRDARGDQLHGDPRARPDLPLPHRRALRAARPAADDAAQRGAPRHRFHRLGRSPRGRDDRHLGRRPLAHDPGGDRPRLDAARPRPARPRLPAARARRRRPRPRGPDGGRGRPRPPRRARPGRRRLRDHERGRDDGPRPRSRAVLRAARAADDHRRRPDRVPAADREARRARRLRPAADGVRPLHRDRLPRDAHGPRPPRARAWARSARTCSSASTPSA